MSRSLLSALLLASLAPFVLPSGAGAETFCAHQPARCTGAAYTTVQAALDAAAALPGRDRVEVGEHAGGAGESIDVAPGNAVDVVGVGAGASILAAGTTPILIREPSAVVRDLQLVARDPATRLVDLEAGTLQDVGLVPRGATAVALRLGAGTLRRVTIADLGRYGDALDTGIVADGAGGTLEDVDITARVGLESSATALALNRVQVVAAASAVHVTGGGLTADDSAFIGNEEAVPVFGVTPAAATAVTLRSTTVNAWGEPGSVGIEAACTGATADVQLVDVLAIGSERDLVRSGAGCTMALDHVGYGARDAGGGAFADGPGVISGSMEPFTDAADFQVAPGWASPAHDAGSARPVAAGETDLAGHPRVVDAARDLGALEYQHRPPAITRVEGPDGAIAVGDDAGFAAFAEDPDGEWLGYAWTLDGAPVAQVFPELPDLGSDFYQLVFTPVTPGPHAIGVTVTDPSGLTATRTVVLPVSAAPGDSVPEPPPPPVVAPVIVKPKAPATASLAIDRHDRTVGRRDHRLAIALTCRQAVRCSGSVRIVLRGNRKLTATLGPAAFAIAAHTTKTIKVTVPAKVVTALRRAKGATATVTAWHGPKATGRRWATATIEVRA